MTHYRAYLLDVSGRVSLPADDIEAESDQQAIEAAKRFLVSHDVALWQGERPVATLSRTPPASPVAQPGELPKPDLSGGHQPEP